MIRRFISISLVALCIVSFTTLTATAKEGPWSRMDYGPFLTASIQAPQPANSGAGANIAQKGLLIRLDENTNVCFDKDLLRYSAGWTGGRIDWRSIVYDGSHGTWPSIAGEQLFANPLQPGWSAADGSFEDRRLQGNDSRRFGPLAHQHARWKGLYVHGDQVVLSYCVGDASILELPGLLEGCETTVFTRTLNVGKSSRDLQLQVVQRPDGQLFYLDSTGKLLRQATKSTPAIAIGRLPGPKRETGEATRPELPSSGLVGHWQSMDGKSIPNQAGKPFAAAATAVAIADGPADNQAFRLTDRSRIEVADADKIELGRGGDWTIAAWIKTSRGGTIFSKAPASGKWVPQGKTLFVRGGKLTYDIGWVGEVRGQKNVADGRWHHVAATFQPKNDSVTLYVDGQLDQAGKLDAGQDVEGHVARIGYTSTDFPGPSPFAGELADVRWYNRALSAEEMAAFSSGDTAAGDTAGGDTLLVAQAIGDAAVAWDLADQRQLRLTIPASATPCRVKLVYGAVAPDKLAAFAAAAGRTGPPIDLAPLTKGGPSRYAEVLTTSGKLGDDKGPFATDTITWPSDNPWQSWMRFGGFDFFADASRAAICTWSGDVWLVDGIDDDLDQLTWRRVATGLFQPLGLKIVDDQIYVCCRDEITRLHDTNGDGEMDFYESFNNDHQVTEHFHEFAMDLQTDAEGNFYYAKSARHALDSLVPHHGTLIKVAKDGSTSEIVCNGFRAANGAGIGPGGILATSDQEGHWMPANRINLCRPGGFYGNLYSYHRGERPTSYDRPVVWLPKNYDRSPAEQLWVTSDQWGPLRGSMLSLSYGTGMPRLIMYEKAGEHFQGAAVDLPIESFPTGIMRGRFHPGDGQLYLCGLFGWSSNKSQPGGFYRVRYTGQPLYLPIQMHASEDGVELTFTEPLDADSARDIDNYAVERWNYRWTSGYGSKHYSVADPRRTGQDEVEVFDAQLADDGRTVSLELDDMRPVQQMRIEFTLKAADGVEFRRTILATINVVGDEVIGD